MWLKGEGLCSSECSTTFLRPQPGDISSTGLRARRPLAPVVPSGEERLGTSSTTLQASSCRRGETESTMHNMHKMAWPVAACTLSPRPAAIFRARPQKTASDEMRLREEIPKSSSLTRCLPTLGHAHIVAVFCLRSTAHAVSTIGSLASASLRTADLTFRMWAEMPLWNMPRATTTSWILFRNAMPGVWNDAVLQLHVF